MPPRIPESPVAKSSIKSRTPVDKIKKSKKLEDKKTKPKLKLKRWLQTPEDWARFNAWADINALPRKVPEPETIIRASKPLSQLKRRIQILSQPLKKPDPNINYKLDVGISKAALNAVPSKRVEELSCPVIRIIDCGREVPMKISQAVLRYEVSPRILEISQPKFFLTKECEDLLLSESTREKSRTAREKRMALTRKLDVCPDLLTMEEWDELFTPMGTKRSALSYKFTPWMLTLSLPPYKFLKGRDDENAVAWKKLLVEEKELKGRIAFEEQTRKRGKVVKKREAGDSKEEMEEARKRKNAWREEPFPCKEDSYRIKRAASRGKASPRIKELAEPRIRETKSSKENPFEVKKSALSAKASARIEMLAKHLRSRSPVEREPPHEKDAYGRPIFEKPIYGKVLPKTKPYKMAECKTPKEKQKTKKRKRTIDPIAFAPTIDPCIDPRTARIQARERKRAERVSKKKKHLNTNRAEKKKGKENNERGKSLEETEKQVDKA